MRNRLTTALSWVPAAILVATALVALFQPAPAPAQLGGTSPAKQTTEADTVAINNIAFIGGEGAINGIVNFLADVRIGHTDADEATHLSLERTTASTTPMANIENNASSGTDTGPGLHIDMNYTSSGAQGLLVQSQSTEAVAFEVNQQGASSDSKYGAQFYTNANQQESPLVLIRSDNASSDHGNPESWIEGAVLLVGSDGDGTPIKTAHNSIAPQTLYKRRYVSGSSNLSVHEYYGYGMSSSVDSIVVTSTNFSVFTISLYASYDVGDDGSIIKKVFIHRTGTATTVATEVSATYGSAASIGTPVVTGSRCAVPISWPSSVCYVELKIVSDQGVSAPEWVN